ncbi:hypothetical protein [Chryseobacterium cucumeris]|uniref:hypothetical protein n=2 Tax=Chryseobacterium TaxID=59732 RepID=UPI000E715931|nr:hypothetical protein [Chryseobacterium cucumeris]MDH5032806.1 hypothetical protein [Chryseobacterium cucumeris]QWT86455.1 hypothetical protein KBP46_00790 [Chryseobacterium sp. PCH239]RKE82108.1 hypothetical protein DEU39_1660 [Chryseobacterium sp. AG363]TXI95191.1 MAG: hypothetical protein E6Q35_10100 [Chryseobacterium cucumeris]
MELTVFQELTQEISLECFFMTESQQEEKVIQLIDLHHFIECFDSEMKILSYLHHSINIVEHEGEKKGILFCDLKHSAVPDSNASEEFRRRYRLSELWFVFVEETFVQDTACYTDAIIENSLDIFYERIFTFSFFQSIIQPLK